MPVKGPTSPLSSGAEQLESLGSKDLHELMKSEKLEQAISQFEKQAPESNQAQQAKSPTFQAMQQIAVNSNLSNPQNASEAVKQSAGFMINSHLKKEFRESKKGKKVVDDLSGFVADDPSMHKRILGILQKMKEKSR